MIELEIKKSKYIYAAAKKKFQTKRPCNTKNMKYYKKGTVRSVANYKLQQDLARGNVLCEDCNGRGMLCGDVNRSNLAKIDMYNNSLSEFQGTGQLTFLPIEDIFTQLPSFPVIKSDINGVWGGSTTDVSKSSIGPDGSNNGIPMPYGYINNLIKIPRNLDGSGIVIDPSNILFPDDNCGVHSYFRNHTNIKTTIVVRGSINFSETIVPADTNFPSNCIDSSYNQLINTFILIWVPRLDDDPTKPLPNLTYGIIKNICCVGKKLIENPPPFIFHAAIVDIYIELYILSSYDDLNFMVNTRPLSLPDGTYQWPEFASPFPAFFLLFPIFPDTLNFSDTTESVRIFQGTCKDNQTTGNKVKQSYMSCLEDGTKKIKFT